MTIYRYGWIAWVWRVLALFGIAATILLVLLATRLGDWWPFMVAVPLAAPSAFFPWVLAIRIDRVGEGEIVVTNLFFARRRIQRESLGRPRVRHTAQAALTHIPAPRAWIPVRGGLPIYVDLYADIPDHRAFRSVFNLPTLP